MTPFDDGRHPFFITLHSASARAFDVLFEELGVDVVSKLVIPLSFVALEEIVDGCGAGLVVAPLRKLAA